MDRQGAKTRQSEHSKITEQAETATTTIEKDEKSITKLLAGKPYSKDDVIKVAQDLLPQYNYDFGRQFFMLEKIENFNAIMADCVVDKPIFVVFGKPKNRWVLFCIVNDKNKNKIVLYKDPCGDPVSSKLSMKIEEKFGEVTYISQTQVDQKNEDEKSYGPLTVRNLKVLLDFLKRDENFEKFSDLNFAKLPELNNEKFNRVADFTKDLAKNEEFKTALKSFVEKLPHDLVTGVVEYRKIMEEELEKGEEGADTARMQQARENYLNQSNIDKFRKDYAISNKNQDEENTDYELEIQKNFPKEMDKLRDIFEVLDNIKIDQDLFDVLKSISEVLDIDYQKLKLLYEFKASQEKAVVDPKLTPEDIASIAKGLPPVKVVEVDDCTPLDKLLEEITLGMDQTPQSPEDLVQLEKKYQQVKTQYENWKNSTLQSINSWAKQVKGHLGTSDDDVCTALAIMDKAFNLLTRGFRLRDTQILAVLIFFHGSQSQGRLCQIQTGEGKTNIVSFLAVIKALQGHKVDVITSNPLLAADGVAETKTFYSVFDLTVSTNNPDGVSAEFKIGYLADVLYGTISNFQFDYLKDTFEGFNLRRERPFGQVILDEVDSMLVDNGGHIAKLASPYPGMECLRYIYIKIWQQLQKAEKKFVEETQKELKELLAKYPDKEEAKIHYEKFLQEKISNKRNIIKEKIKASNPTNVPLVPLHLKEYVQSKLDVWIKNALHAKYNCHEHQQYRIVKDDSGEGVIAPVDYLNTGVTLRNTIWSNGLHQFVQLKHNLYLTFESLTSSFISNIGYIKNYQDKNIFGLTGTLGSRAEQELLAQIYKVDYAKLPTYKKKKFMELEGIIAEDSVWANKVTEEVMEMTDVGRAVLVICETEQDLLTVEQNLEILKTDDFRIRKFANEENSNETEGKVKSGDVILATNIAGRGTNFKTEKSLEAKGGLHVCVGFLPCNLRVEGQAFGRTSRQGNSGTAQLIIRKSEVEELEIVDENPGFGRIKEERDGLERQRLKQIKEVLVKELNFKDELFGYFATFYRNLKQVKMTEGYRYVLQDLKEFWAFWLEKKNFKVKTIVNTTPQQEFETFKKETNSIIEGEGTISHNPFYCIALADYYLEKGNDNKAENILLQCVNMGGKDNYELLAGAHLKLFELAIAGGHQVMERFKKAVAAIFFVKINKKENCLKKAVEELQHAKNAIRKEVDYVEKFLSVEDSSFREIINSGQEENFFIKHVQSRLYCLKIHLSNIDHLLEQINNKTQSEGLDINGKAPTNIESLKQMTQDSNLTKTITTCEMFELQSIGLDAIYSLREVYDVPDLVIHVAQGQILGGIAALCVGLAFLPIFPLMSALAGTMISEGIIDIVMEILTQGSAEFDQKDFMKGKFISYGISLITFGLSAVTQSVKILSKAVSWCRKLSSFLRKSTYLKSVCNKLANLVDRLGDVLELMLQTAKFNKLAKVDQLEELKRLQQSGSLDKFEHLGGMKKLSELEDLQKVGQLRELTRGELFVDFVQDVACNTGKQIAKSIVKEQVINPLLNLVFKDIIEKIKENFKKALKDSIKKNDSLLEKLRTTPPENITEAVDKFVEKDETRETVEEVGGELLGLLNNTVVDVLTTTYEVVSKIVEFDRYVHQFSSFMSSHLEGGSCNNDTDAIIEEICSRLTEDMFSLWCDIWKGSLSGVKTGLEWALDKSVSKEKKIEGGVVVKANEQSSVSDPYQVLGLQEGASWAEVKKQYRRMALQVHPDKNRNDPKAKEKFQKLEEAYNKIKENAVSKAVT